MTAEELLDRYAAAAYRMLERLGEPWRAVHGPSNTVDFYGRPITPRGFTGDRLIAYVPDKRRRGKR